jgi:hypothetical protein
MKIFVKLCPFVWKTPMLAPVACRSLVLAWGIFCLLLMSGLVCTGYAQQQEEQPAVSTEVTADDSQEPDKARDAEETADSETETDAKGTKLIPELKYRQHPGLAYAASKIYFSDQKYSVSGFGEINAVRYAGESNRESGDIELFYTNLYRFSAFLGYKFTNRLIFNFEFLGEFIHDGTRDYGSDVVIEAMLDYLIHPKFNTRFGLFPLPIGYVNNNDEPVMFNSVNRPEVERIIIPTAWIMLGTEVFGQVVGDLSYTAGIVSGLNANDFIGGTWIRQGRFIGHGIPKDFAGVGQLIYSKGERMQFGLSGYHGASGVDGTLEALGRVKMPTTMATLHGRYHTDRYSITAVAARGQLGRTVEAFERTGQVLGARTSGHYVELDHDILPYFLPNRGNRKLNVFSRFEWLNTHSVTDAALRNLPRTEQDLRIITIGATYAPKRSLIFKGNYQFRTNRFATPAVPESDLAEFGLGFIY